MILRPLFFTAVLGTFLGIGAGCGGGNGAGHGDGGAPGNGDLAAMKYPAPFSTTTFNAVRITSVAGQPNYQQATADFELKAGPYATASFVVDLGSTCYPFSSWTNDEPPANQAWPADCDTQDRIFLITLDDPLSMSDPPPIELVHAITPFGGPEHLSVDVTDLANGLGAGTHRLKVVIPTLSDGSGKQSGSAGGWSVTARFDFTPGAAPRNVLGIIPLYDSANSPAMQPAINFTVPIGTKTAHLEMHASGHGAVTGDAACKGVAEETCHRVLTVQVDGASLTGIDPYRSACPCTSAQYQTLTYCLENPCGDADVIEEARANWCPGSMTAPFVWDSAALDTPGSHALSWTFSRIAIGGNWQVAAFYIAYGD